MKRILPRLMIWESVGYILLIIFVFGTALLPPSGYMIFGDDIHHQYYFFRQFFNQFFHSGVLPWWNPYLFGGQPFVADPMVNIWYPPNWLYIVLPLNIAYSWHIAFHIFWACLGMNVLMKTIITRDTLASWIGGVMFGLSGFFMARTFGGHVDVIAAASWIPWVVHAFARVLRIQFIVHRKEVEKKSFVVASIVFAFQLLSGYQTMAFMTGIIVGIMASIRAIFEKRWQPVVYAVRAGLLGVGLVAFHIVPVQEFFRLSIRTYPLPYSWVSYGSWTWQSVIQLLNPFYFGTVTTYAGPPPNFIEHSAFIGVGGLTLALMGLMYGIRRVSFMVSSFVVIGVFGLWISLGPNAPVDFQYIVWKLIPMYHFLRIPPRHLILVIFSLVGLATIGFGNVLPSNKIVRALIAGIIVVEMGMFGRHFITLKPVPETREDTALIRILQSNKEPSRVLQDFGVWLPQRDGLEFDAVMPKGIFSATGYDTSILRSYFEYVSNATGKKGSEAILSHDVQVPYLTPEASDALDFLNITHIIVPRLLDPYRGNSRYTPIYEQPTQDIRVYENTTAKSRFFLEHESCGSVRVRSYTPNRIVIDVDLTCDTTLLSSESWYPGWYATVDGKKTNIDKLYNAFRVLSVSKGNHTIVYTYTPLIFIIGGAISLCTSICMWYVYRRRIL